MSTHQPYRSFVDRLRQQFLGRKDDVKGALLTLNGKQDAIIAGLDNLAKLLNDRLPELVLGIENQTQLLASRFDAIVAGMDNKSQLLNRHLTSLIQGSNHQSKQFDTNLKNLIAGMNNQSQLLNRKLGEIANRLEFARPVARQGAARRGQSAQQFGAAAKRPGAPPEGRVAQISQLSTDRQSGATAAGAPPGADRIKVIGLEAFADVFKDIQPWSGNVPPQFIVDFLGMLIDIEFHPMLFTDPNFDPDPVGGGFEQTAIPRLADVRTPADAEAWFEAVDWVVSAREARDRYVMITLGANYGAQAVGAYPRAADGQSLAVQAGGGRTGAGKYRVDPAPYAEQRHRS